MQVLQLLREKAPVGRLPGRQHFDPITVPQLIGYINIAEVARDGDKIRFKFRLYGSQQLDIAGRDLTGCFVDEVVDPAFAARIDTNMRTVVEQKLPVYDRFNNPIHDRGFIDTERVYYPLAENGETVDMILILNGYFS